MASQRTLPPPAPNPEQTEELQILCSELHHGFYARPALDSADRPVWDKAYIKKAIALVKLLTKVYVKELPHIAIACAYEMNRVSRAKSQKSMHQFDIEALHPRNAPHPSTDPCPGESRLKFHARNDGAIALFPEEDRYVTWWRCDGNPSNAPEEAPKKKPKKRKARPRRLPGHQLPQQALENDSDAPATKRPRAAGADVAAEEGFPPEEIPFHWILRKTPCNKCTKRNVPCYFWPIKGGVCLGCTDKKLGCNYTVGKNTTSTRVAGYLSWRYWKQCEDPATYGAPTPIPPEWASLEGPVPAWFVDAAAEMWRLYGRRTPPIPPEYLAASPAAPAKRTKARAADAEAPAPRPAAPRLDESASAARSLPTKPSASALHRRASSPSKTALQDAVLASIGRYKGPEFDIPDCDYEAKREYVEIEDTDSATEPVTAVRLQPAMPEHAGLTDMPEVIDVDQLDSPQTATKTPPLPKRLVPEPEAMEVDGVKMQSKTPCTGWAGARLLPLPRSPGADSLQDSWRAIPPLPRPAAAKPAPVLPTPWAPGQLAEAVSRLAPPADPGAESLLPSGPPERLSAHLPHARVFQWSPETLALLDSISSRKWRNESICMYLDSTTQKTRELQQRIVQRRASLATAVQPPATPSDAVRDVVALSSAMLADTDSIATIIGSAAQLFDRIRISLDAAVPTGTLLASLADMADILFQLRKLYGTASAHIESSQESVDSLWAELRRIGDVISRLQDNTRSLPEACSRAVEPMLCAMMESINTKKADVRDPISIVLAFFDGVEDMTHEQVYALRVALHTDWPTLRERMDRFNTPSPSDNGLASDNGLITDDSPALNAEPAAGGTLSHCNQSLSDIERRICTLETWLEKALPARVAEQGEFVALGTRLRNVEDSLELRGSFDAADLEHRLGALEDGQKSCSAAQVAQLDKQLADVRGGHGGLERRLSELAEKVAKIEAEQNSQIVGLAVRIPAACDVPMEAVPVYGPALPDAAALLQSLAELSERISKMEKGGEKPDSQPSHSGGDDVAEAVRRALADMGLGPAAIRRLNVRYESSDDSNFEDSDSEAPVLGGEDSEDDADDNDNQSLYIHAVGGV
ncbi:hypothetical protein C8Q80DRAFT_1275889 [Daedaleopsis nitida]|nr:hypothetical protein C8Q80DRAFT_1275889 [Daedaleopsis nitida]